MPRRRDLSNMPKHVYRELYHFCLQYPDWKEREIFPGSDIQLIQDTVKETAPPEAQKALLLNVTQDVNYIALRMRYDLAVSEHGFQEIRRDFFYNLAKKKGRI